MKAGLLYNKIKEPFKLDGIEKEDLLPFFLKLREFNYDEQSIEYKLEEADIDEPEACLP